MEKMGRTLELRVNWSKMKIVMNRIWVDGKINVDNDGKIISKVVLCDLRKWHGIKIEIWIKFRPSSSRGYNNLLSDIRCLSCCVQESPKFSRDFNIIDYANWISRDVELFHQFGSDERKKKLSKILKSDYFTSIVI